VREDLYVLQNQLKRFTETPSWTSLLGDGSRLKRDSGISYPAGLRGDGLVVCAGQCWRRSDNDIGLIGGAAIERIEQRVIYCAVISVL